MIGIGEAINVHTKRGSRLVCTIAVLIMGEGGGFYRRGSVVQLEVACLVVDLLMCIKSTGV